ncbi:hypothetical protein DSO57_1030121 [Entomophthora muscae]|uniref:Uncharacterized protein n=1 Tax=Entomophthora muscae TaxID=34485 RepID=A0ACC2UN16_9FUNG|nr:hypothetical protein DSO57_1030121 [Entomophthora muscae]
MAKAAKTKSRTKPSARTKVAKRHMATRARATQPSCPDKIEISAKGGCYFFDLDPFIKREDAPEITYVGDKVLFAVLCEVMKTPAGFKEAKIKEGNTFY